MRTLVPRSPLACAAQRHEAKSTCLFRIGHDPSAGGSFQANSSAAWSAHEDLSAWCADDGSAGRRIDAGGMHSKAGLRVLDGGFSRGEGERVHLGSVFLPPPVELFGRFEWRHEPCAFAAPPNDQSAITETVGRTQVGLMQYHVSPSTGWARPAHVHAAGKLAKIRVGRGVSSERNQPSRMRHSSMTLPLGARTALDPARLHKMVPDDRETSMGLIAVKACKYARAARRVGN